MRRTDLKRPGQGNELFVPDVSLCMRRPCKRIPLALTLLTLALSASAFAQGIKDVRTVYDAGGNGNAYFNAQLRRQIRAVGIRFVANRQKADAILSSQGDWKGQGFAGSVTLRNQRGGLIWQRHVARPSNSRSMAFDQLGAMLRQVRRKPKN